MSQKNYDSLWTKYEKKNYTPQDFYKNLFFDKITTQLNSLGHQIGLTSQPPYIIRKIALEDQEKEYRQCLKIIANILKEIKIK